MARIWQSPFVRLAGYYVLLGLAVVLLLAVFPPLRDLFARAQELSSIHGVSKSKAIEEAATSPGIGSLGFRALGLLTALDRKSTRLNSSHLVISYAVFCLKKKKKKNNRDNTSIEDEECVRYEA